MNALMTDGDALKTKEREQFTKVWASYMNSSGAKVPGLDTTYENLNQGVTNLFAQGGLPTQIGTVDAPAAKEPEKKKKEPKPLPSDYIQKATDDKVVAEEDKEEE